MQNALLKAEEEQARVEPKSVAKKMRRVVRRKKAVPMGSQSVASKSPSVASRQKPVPSQGSVRGRPISVVNKSPAAASGQKSVASKSGLRPQRRKPDTREAAPPVPSSARTTVEVKGKTLSKVVRQPKGNTPPKGRQSKGKAPPKERQPKGKPPPKGRQPKVEAPKVKTPIKVIVRQPVEGSRQPFQGSRPQNSTAPADKSYACTIM